jgi:hypothetical protein
MHRITLIATVVLTTALVVPSAHATTRPTPRTHRTSLTAQGQVTVGTPFCDDQQHCLYPGTRPLTFSGDWQGTGLEAGAVSLNPPKFAGANTWLFVGTIKGCGTGTLVLTVRETGVLTDFSATGTWQIKQGFGTGDLTEASGHGTGRGSAAAGTQAHGDITC